MYVTMATAKENSTDTHSAACFAMRAVISSGWELPAGILGDNLSSATLDVASLDSIRLTASHDRPSSHLRLLMRSRKF